MLSALRADISTSTVRDEFESKKAEHESKIANLIGVDVSPCYLQRYRCSDCVQSFKITANANQIFAYTETSGYGKVRLTAPSFFALH